MKSFWFRCLVVLAAIFAILLLIFVCGFGCLSALRSLQFGLGSNNDTIREASDFDKIEILFRLVIFNIGWLINVFYPVEKLVEVLKQTREHHCGSEP